ncbi:MAG: aldo/keto reductase [Bacteroidales bacterium]|nr:aldo/keto reductase [Bacteroidales bacterium]
MQELDRREFLKRMGAGAAVIGATSALNSCTGGAGSAISQNFDPAGSGNKPIGEMTYRTNKHNGDKVSLLGYGCMRWPSIPNSDELDQETINHLVDVAIEHGLNYFDTSPAYLRGRSERVTGIALKRHPREKYFIATKLSNFAAQQQSYEASVALYKNSFKELQVDYIDYLLLHAVGGSKEDMQKRYLDNGVLDFLVEEKKKGKIRNLGFSFHGTKEVFDWLMEMHDNEQYHWDFVQIQMNYVDLDTSEPPARYLYEELTKRDIPVVIMEPLLGGRLSNLPNHVIAHLKQREPENSAASWAFRFLGSFPNILTVLSGMTYMEHLEDNLRSYCPLDPLTDEDFKYLEETAKLIQSYPTIPCNDCKYCMPCPYGIDIPGILVHYNKFVNEGTMPADQGDENYKQLRRNYLISYNRSIESLRQADHCIQCKKCNHHCPQRINIPRELETIANFIEQLKREGR